MNGLERLKAEAKEAGRDFNTLPVKLNMGFSISHDRKEAREEMKGMGGGLRSIFVDGRGTFPPELERFREEARRVGEAYDYRNHFMAHTPDGQLTPHAKLMSDELAEALGGFGTPQEMLPKFKALWQAIDQMPNVGLFLVPHGSKSGRKRTFELFVNEILPKLRGR